VIGQKGNSEQLRLFSAKQSGAKPFLKWAGGKQQLLTQLSSRLPPTFNRYFEPFLGSGALFFALQPTEASLSDVNEELILTFLAVRDDVDSVLGALKRHRNERLHFEEVRRVDVHSLALAERAARFIYLNRTCYNGLYRVNKKGMFNTPFGNYEKPNINNESVLRAASEALQDVTLRISGYEEALEFAEHGDFIYLDPPYVPVSRYSDFKRYDKTTFGKNEHERLAQIFASLSQRGCFVMLSNSYTELTVSLYKSWNIAKIPAKRLINSRSTGRGSVTEILVTNY
jgi:DNA adenine methylase